MKIKIIYFIIISIISLILTIYDKIASKIESGKMSSYFLPLLVGDFLCILL